MSYTEKNEKQDRHPLFGDVSIGKERREDTDKLFSSRLDSFSKEKITRVHGNEDKLAVETRKKFNPNVGGVEKKQREGSICRMF